jgi:hypothetical protein
MFSSLLFRAITVGENVFHVLCSSNLDISMWENLGLEILKDAAAIKQQMQAAPVVATPESEVAPVSEPACASCEVIPIVEPKPAE